MYDDAGNQTSVEIRVQRLRYSLTVQGTLGGSESKPFDINNAGQVVGQSRSATEEWRAFVWQNGQMAALDTLQAAPGESFPWSGVGDRVATAINDQGEIVGRDGVHAVRWRQGTIADLGIALALPIAMDINESGVIVGGWRERGCTMCQTGSFLV